MKLKSLFLIFGLLIGAGLTQLSAQNEPQTLTGFDSGPFYTEVFCDGAIVDVISGWLDFHYVAKLRKGEWTIFYQAKGQGKSILDPNNPETFVYKEKDKVSYGEGVYQWTYHLKGDMGSRYMGHITWNMVTDVITVGAANCK